LFEASKELGKTGEFREVLDSLNLIFSENPLFFNLLRSPAVAAQDRQQAAREVLKGKVPDEILNFLYVLIGKKRIGQYRGIVKAFEKLADREDGVTKGRIFSAMPLEKNQVERFEEQTGKLMKMNVALEADVDPSLIGGVRIYVEGKLIDASIRKRLDDMKEQLTV